jgi:hypothetical protein
MNVTSRNAPRQEKSHENLYHRRHELHFSLRHSQGSQRSRRAQAFATEEQFADAIGNDTTRLIEIWNSLPGVKPVKKFTNRKVATERIWRAIQGLAGPAAPAAEEAPAELTAPVPTPEPETPFDGIEASPGPVVSETQASIETAVAQVGDQPAYAQAEPGEPVATAGAQEPDVAPRKVKATKKATAAKNAPKGKKTAKGKDAGPREGTKTTQVVALLQRKGGATLAEIMEKMGWQRHTVRGFMAGAMKKAGFTVESFKNATDERTYRINK